MITIRIKPIRQELSIAFNRVLGPDARAAVLAQQARRILSEADQRNAAALGQAPEHRTFVDGAATEAIERVRAEGVVVRTYDVIGVALIEIGNMLWTHSPVRSGHYQRSHVLLADGDEIAIVRSGWELPPLQPLVREFTFSPEVDYARPIERGWSKKAPDGVYQVVAELAKQSYGRLARIEFGYREVIGIDESRKERSVRPNAPRNLRNPAIIVRPR